MGLLSPMEPQANLIFVSKIIVVIVKEQKQKRKERRLGDGTRTQWSYPNEDNGKLILSPLQILDCCNVWLPTVYTYFRSDGGFKPVLRANVLQPPSSLRFHAHNATFWSCCAFFCTCWGREAVWTAGPTCLPWEVRSNWTARSQTRWEFSPSSSASPWTPTPSFCREGG